MFDTLTDVETAVDKLLASESAADVVRLRRVIERLECAWLASVREAERSGEWQADGFVSTAAWLRAKCNLTPEKRTRSVPLARTLDSLPVTAEAFVAGRSPASTSKSSPGRRGRNSPRSKPRWWRSRGTRPRSRCVRSCSRSPTPSTAMVASPRERPVRAAGGVPVVDARRHGCAERDARSRSNGVPVDRVRRRDRDDPPRGDPRSRPQQRADALVELVKVGLANYAQGPGRRTQPHISLVADVEILGPPTRRSRPRDPRRRRARRPPLGGDDRTVRVRRRHHPRPHQGPLRTPRRRPRNPSDLARAVEGARRARPRLRRPVVIATRLVRGPPPKTVVTRRSDQPRELRTPLLATPPRRTRRPRTCTLNGSRPPSVVARWPRRIP